MPRRARTFSQRWPRPKPAPTIKRVLANRFYNSKAWRTTRREFLSENPKCAHCERQGYLTAATEVDHIHALRRGGAPHAWDNLQALCRSCHSRKTRAENRVARTHPQSA